MKKYQKKLLFSYSLGVYPTLELLKHHSDKVRSVILHSKSGRNAGVEEIRRLCKKNNISLQFSDQKIQQLSVKDNCLAVGVFNKYLQTLAAVDHVVLVHPRNLGNLGTIIRTAVGFGFKDIAIIKPAADIWNPMVIRSTMGAIFGSRIHLFDSFADYEKLYTNHKYCLTPNSNTKLEGAVFKHPFSLIFGNESEGLSKKILTQANTLSIPQSKNIDSFNLAVSVGIVLYHVSVYAKFN